MCVSLRGQGVGSGREETDTDRGRETGERQAPVRPVDRVASARAQHAGNGFGPVFQVGTEAGGLK